MSSHFFIFVFLPTMYANGIKKRAEVWKSDANTTIPENAKSYVLLSGEEKRAR